MKKGYIKRLKNIFKVPFLVIVSGFLAASNVWAVMDLNVTPTDGGNSIRFGIVDLPTAVNAEVRIRVTSNESKQYQVFQRIQEPFISDQGEQLDRQIIQASALIGSNSTGSLYLQDVERMTFSDQLIYTSSPNGLSDSFTMIYQINPDEIRAAGDFFGKILYTLRPVGGGFEDEVVLNAFVDTHDEPFTFDIDSESGTGLIELGSASELDQERKVELSFKGFRGRSLRIYQQIDQFPINEEGEILNKDTVTFFVRGGEAGETDYFQPSPLAQRRVLIYEGEAAEDFIVVNYMLDEEGLADQLAGNYKGHLNYIVEADNVNQVYPFEFNVDIIPVFELTAEYPPEGVSFKEFLPTSPPQKKEVLVSVRTNLGKPYEVIQSMSGPLANEEGQPIERDHFTMKQALLPGEEGRIKTDEFKPVRDGDVTLFQSNRDGSPARFKVIYRLSPYNSMPPGHYRTAVVFSLNEI